MRQVGQLPGVDRVSLGSSVAWRDARGSFGGQFSVEGYARADGEDDRGPAGALRRRDFLQHWTCRSLPAAISLTTTGATATIGHRQSEPGAADVPERRGCPQPRAHVDRTELPAVRRRQWQTAAHRGRRRGHRRREHRAAAYDDGL